MLRATFLTVNALVQDTTARASGVGPATIEHEACLA
jgi:hypothetical protein